MLMIISAGKHHVFRSHQASWEHENKDRDKLISVALPLACFGQDKYCSRHTATNSCFLKVSLSHSSISRRLFLFFYLIDKVSKRCWLLTLLLLSSLPTTVDTSFQIKWQQNNKGFEGAFRGYSLNALSDACKLFDVRMFCVTLSNIF